MLNRVGILIFIHQHMIKTGSQRYRNIGMLTQQHHHIENQIGKIHAFMLFQLLLIGGIQLNHIDAIPVKFLRLLRPESGMLAMLNPVQQIGWMKSICVNIA